MKSILQQLEMATGIRKHCVTVARRSAGGCALYHGSRKRLFSLQASLVVEGKVLADLIYHSGDYLLLDRRCIRFVSVLVRTPPPAGNALLKGSMEDKIGADLHPTAHRELCSHHDW